MTNSLPVFINGSFMTQPFTGVQRYATEITKRLISLDKSNDPAYRCIRVLTHSGQHFGMARRNIWEQVNLLAQSAQGILFSPSGMGPWLHPRHLVTIHDIRAYSTAHADSLPSRTRNWQRASFRALTKTAAMILTDSNYSKSCILNTFHLYDNRVKVIYPGADHILEIPPDPEVLSRLHLEPQKYVLAVGSLYPHKNLGILHSINWQKYDLKLCIVGEAPDTNAKSFMKVVEEARNQPAHILYTGRRTDAEIKSLYTHAFAYVLPSLYEGFGFPPLEAMFCGCPVIASDRTSIPEVCGDAALYFDPLSSESLRRAVDRIVTDDAMRKTLIENGYQRSNQFRWDRAAQQIMDVLNQM
jgi:glycosyltransferase involved in cell wall biosynthesis